MLRNDDLQPVIMAAGKGTRMTELVTNLPKCLLNVGNKPMIQYSLEMLIKANFKSTIVFVLAKEMPVIEYAINKLNLAIEVQYIQIHGQSDFGTAENFRSILNSKITKDLLIISADIVTDYDLTEYIRFYRKKDATLMCLFSRIPATKEDLAPARKLAPNTEYDIVGLDLDEPNHLVYFEPDSKFTDAVAIKKSILQQCPAMKLSTKYQDAHVYILKNWLLKYIAMKEKEQISSIKGDLVPSIVRKQFRKPKSLGEASCHQSGNSYGDVKDDDSKSDTGEKKDQEQVFFKCYERTEVEEVMNEFENLGLENFADEIETKNPIRCYALVCEDGYCVRTNNLLRFCEVNRVLLKHLPTRNTRTEKLKSYVDGIVGVDTEVGEKCSIKRTVLGANCVIGNKVTLFNCILLDGVKVQEGVVLKNCLVCARTEIEKGVELNDCIVGPRKNIPEGSRHTNEALLNDIDF